MGFELVWIFIAQLVEHWSTNQEAMGTNSIKVWKFFCVNFCVNYHCDQRIFI